MVQTKHLVQRVVRRTRGLQRIAAILEAAEIVFAKMSYEEATIQRIAVQAELSLDSLSQYFASKEKIMHALAVRYSEELQDIYNTVFAGQGLSFTIESWLDRLFDALVDFQRRHPAFSTLLSAPPQVLIGTLGLELQARLELGLQVRAPQLSSEQRHLSALMLLQLLKATLQLFAHADVSDQPRLLQECKAVLYRYLDPLLV